MTLDTPSSYNSSRKRRAGWVLDLLLVIVLVVAALLRMAGLYWGEYTYMHPDERFLVWVGTDITPLKCENDALPVESCPPEQRTWMGPKEYFDTARSTLNPNNRGHGFYVYGTLPMFMTRYAVEWIYGHSGFEEMTNVGRPLSALADLLTVLLVYMVAERLYGRRVGLLAAAFSALAVLQIQQSHFFTMDTFVTFFMLLAFYFAVRVMVDRRDWGLTRSQSRTISTGEVVASSTDGTASIAPTSPGLTDMLWAFFRHPLFLPSLGFGLALGMAVASKLNAAPVAIVLPAAMAIRWLDFPVEKRQSYAIQAAIYLGMAAVFSLLVFRIFQPYAFSGPGFFGLKPNPQWVANIREQRAQSNGDVDFPPAMQWARRNVLFSGKNLVLWGLGLPLGILAWAGFLWAGWRILKGEWRKHALLWGWTALYFVWQSTALNPTMRYQMPIYPLLAIFAGWAVMAMWDIGTQKGMNQPQAGGQESGAPRRSGSRLPRLLAVIVGGGVLLLTAAYAIGFTTIYLRPFTRVAGSRWIYQNIPGPINLHIQTAQGMYSQPLPFPYNYTITPGVPYQSPIKPNARGVLSEIYLPHIFDQQGDHQARTLNLTISSGVQTLASASVSDDFSSSNDPRGKGYTFKLDQPVALNENGNYSIRLEVSGGNVPAGSVPNGTVTLHILPDGGIFTNQMLEPWAMLQPGVPYTLSFTPTSSGQLSSLSLTDITETTPLAQAGQVNITVQMPDESTESIVASLQPQEGPNGPEYLINFEQPIPVTQGQNYQLTLDMVSQGGALTLSGAALANEGDWDDSLPLRIDNYDGFGGIYPQGLDFNMYADDNPEKLARFTRILNDSEYMVITSSRQWGSLPRIPERFPMTAVYYRNLIGCPADMQIGTCYEKAQPGMFQGNLGYDLVQVFESDPALGPLKVNDQSSEEAFTVYDHPKVFVFKKNSTYDPQKVAATLGAVDFSQIIRLPPLRFGSQPANLMLPFERWAEQQVGGTWSKLFNRLAPINRYPALSVTAWYLSVFLLGLIAYPVVRLALPGLSDGGYPLARTAGMLVLSYLVWLAGSFRIPFSRTTITLVLLLMVLVAALLAYRQRKELRAIWRSQRRYFLIIEGLFLAFFVVDLLIRLGNPDLWHPYKGGEKPMDFSYFNAILKSTSFPPYDPWYAGGYLNYYYFGFLFVGILVKWLGIVPAVAYNLILPTIFSLVAMGAFSIAYNLIKGKPETPALVPGVGGDGQSPPSVPSGEHPEPMQPNEAAEPAVRSQAFAASYPAGMPGPQSLVRLPETEISRPASLPTPEEQLTGQQTGSGEWVTQTPDVSPEVLNSPDQAATARISPYWAGLFAAFGMAILGNLGTVRMIYQGYQRLAAPGGVIDNASLLTRGVWALRGLAMALAGASLPYGVADWYWLPSRAIPAPGDVEPITEFPFFTVLYGDPHAHLFALPIALLALGFALAVVLGGGRWKGLLGVAAGFLLGGLAIGALRPTNTWDFYTYLAIGVVAVAYALWFNFNPDTRFPRLLSFLDELPLFSRRLLAAACGVVVLAGLSFILYQPFAQWFGAAYTKVDLWKGTHTPVDSYLVHWGLFLFVIVSWMAWETRDWMASTPLSELRRLAPYKGLIQGALIFLALAILGLLWFKVQIAWLALPLAAWAGVLLLRPVQSDAKRFVLFLTGTGLVLTLVVEVIVLRGDIGRMNTVFKFYLQVWSLFAVCAAAALAWLLMALPGWLPAWRRTWQVVLVALVAGAALYPLLASSGKIRDRMFTDAPHTLDGMEYMQYGTYDWQGVMDLSQDYRGIRWMQENVQGSPVIVEANLRDLYRWGSRYSIYTGLPGVVGWEWHEQQQRALVPGSWISSRIQEIDNFYNTSDLGLAKAFLQKYGVKYVVVGQLERNHYPGPGLDKFPAANGVLWKAVFQDGDTTIYEVIEP